MIKRHTTAHARAAGCLWLAVAGWLLLFLATVGAIIPLDPQSLLLAYVGPPITLFGLVAIAGQFRVVSALSVLAGLFYSAVGVWDFLRAAEFERLHPDSMDASGGGISIILVLLAGGAALWSLSALAVLQRSARGAKHGSRDGVSDSP
jgi:hypothetical protein